MTLRGRTRMGWGLVPGWAGASGPVLRVDPGRELRSIAAAVRAAEPGSTLLIDASRYPGDVALIDKDDLQLRAVGGRVELPVAGAWVEGKGSLVVRARDVCIEGFDLRHAGVPDRAFFDNEAGLLVGNDAALDLRAERCEFARNGTGDGYTHQLHAGLLRSLWVVGSHFHDGRSCHHIKSRAARSQVLYNRVTDEDWGRASYELELPHGGEVQVVDNLVQQSASTETRTMLSSSVEGYCGARRTLQLVHNLFDDRRRLRGRFFSMRAGAVKAWSFNNPLLSGGGASEESFVGAAGNQALPRDAFADADAIPSGCAPASPWWACAPPSCPPTCCRCSSTVSPGSWPLSETRPAGPAPCSSSPDPLPAFP